MSQQIQITLETGEQEFLLADLLKELQDFLKDKDFEIINGIKTRKTSKRKKDSNS